MSITEIAIKRPILFIVLFLVLGGFGFIAYTNLKYELLPDLATPVTTIFTTYPGASPTEVENSVTKKIEEGVSGVSKIKKVTASSSENLSVVTVEFTADADGDQAVQEVQRAINKISAELPIGVKTPSIEKLNVNDVPVLRLGITAAKATEATLYSIIKNQVKPRIAQIKNIGRVVILGGAEAEVKIFADQDKMISYGISNAELTEAVRKNNSDIPVGNIKDSDAALGIRIAGKMADFAELENQPVRTLADGSTIKIKDVSRIITAAKETEVINRLNETPSIGLFIGKQTGSNAVDASAKVREELTRMETEYKSIGLKFSIAQDSSEFTLAAANAVYHDLFIAILLVALVMLIFLHSLRNALIVMLAIPASLVSAFIMMYLLNYSLNLMTLLAMSLVIGILVDDSIVVLENIYRHLEMGKDKRTASLDGRNEIGFAALSITLVDVVVFLPMALVPGLVGSLVKQFSLVIVVSTLSSLLVSFTLTPMIASRFAKLEHLNSESFFGKIGLFFEKLISGLTNWYQGILQWSLKHKLITLSITLLLLIGAFSLVGTGLVGAEFAPNTDKGELSLLINMQPGTKLSETNNAVAAIENKLKSIPEITKTFTNVGYQSDGLNENYSSHLAAVNISLVSGTERKKSLQDLGREVRILAMQVPGVKARVSPIGLLGANDAPIQILLSGEDRDSVFATASVILSAMRSIPGIVNPRLSAEAGKPEIEIIINREKAALLGLNLEEIGANMRYAVNGYDVLKFRNKSEEVDVRIQLSEDERNNTDALKKFSFINDKGQLVYLNQFANIRLTSGPNALERRNKQASIIVLSQVIGRPVGDAGEDIKKVVAGIGIPPSVKISYEGDLELQDDSFGSLGTALLTSFLLIYLIMVVLYNNWVYPFVVLFSIPVALVGAFLALALTAKSLNIFSIFGLIMMMGLVAKNAILLVDRANDAREEGQY
jgi:hydrophobe/amphiphile efflux-1 (HAE1) family protein